MHLRLVPMSVRDITEQVNLNVIRTKKCVSVCAFKIRCTNLTFFLGATKIPYWR